MNVYHNLDEILSSLCTYVLEYGDLVSTRNKLTREIYPCNFVLENVSNRCIVNPKRKWSMPLALGELAWHLDGSDSLEHLTYYASQWGHFSTGNKIVESCYGKKIFRGENSQWKRLINLLKEDPFSRRAVLSFHNGNNTLRHDLNDVSCTVSLQFLIRKGRLDAITYMRSNDVILGLPYDIFLFTMLQEILARELGVECGRYFHNVGSMHIYERHFELAEVIRDSRFNSFLTMSPVEELNLLEDYLSFERELRFNNKVPAFDNASYWGTLKEILLSFRLKKSGDTIGARTLIEENPYRFALTPIL